MRAFFKSFVYAYKGTITAVKSERNLRFHIIAATYALWLAYMYKLPQTQLILLLIIIAMVISAELFNSAIELSCDKADTKYCKKVGSIKDIAAAAVLTNAVVAAIIGIVLFFNINMFIKIGLMMIDNPIFLVVFILSLAVSYKFIFHFKEG